MTKNLDYYLSLPWTYNTQSRLENGETIFLVCIKEWSEICGEGPDEAEAVKALEEALEAAVKHNMQLGVKIPEPK